MISFLSRTNPVHTSPTKIALTEEIIKRLMLYDHQHAHITGHLQTPIYHYHTTRMDDGTWSLWTYTATQIKHGLEQPRVHRLPCIESLLYYFDQPADDLTHTQITTTIHCLVLRASLLPYYGQVAGPTLWQMAVARSVISLLNSNFTNTILYCAQSRHGATSGCGWRNGLRYGG